MVQILVGNILRADVGDKDMTFFEFAFVTLAMDRACEIALSYAHDAKARGRQGREAGVCLWGIWACEVAK